MTEENGSTKNEQPSAARRFVMRWPVQLLILPLFYSLILFLAAGDLAWLWGWIFVAFYLLSSLLVLLTVRDPALIAERENPPADAQEWDQRLLRLYSLAMIAVLIVAGLQERFEWPPAVSLVVHLIGLVGLLGTAVLGAWSMRANTYFSAVVRIQEDRDHTVVDHGPYRFIRHPGNLSMILWALGVPLTLGSLWALLPAILATAVVVRRTALEDATLQVELPGYDKYARQARYRLLPAVW